MIDGVTNAQSVPVLERLIEFAGRRHRLIVNNIANFDTPGFRPVDLPVKEFREQLGEAVDGRRAEGRRTGLAPVEVAPQRLAENILFHDGGDRDLERTMQDLAENFLAFRTAAELLRSRLDVINSAIRERI